MVQGTASGAVFDLRCCWESGNAAAIRAAYAYGAPVIGLCGGYQMLGKVVSDPVAIEGGGSCEGLGLLDVRTELAPRKTTRVTRARIVGAPGASRTTRAPALEGYEIHHGETTLGEGALPSLTTERDDGEVVLGACSGSVRGTYLHGLFANDAFRREWLRTLRVESASDGWKDRLEREIDRLTDVVDSALDPDFLTGFVVAGAA
jgi:adenosylcobyric acid synthase